MQHWDCHMSRGCYCSTYTFMCLLIQSTTVCIWLHFCCFIIGLSNGNRQYEWINYVFGFKSTCVCNWKIKVYDNTKNVVILTPTNILAVKHHTMFCRCLPSHTRLWQIITCSWRVHSSSLTWSQQVRAVSRSSLQNKTPRQQSWPWAEGCLLLFQVGEIIVILLWDAKYVGSVAPLTITDHKRLLQ